jgi:hypothetical protein
MCGVNYVSFDRQWIINNMTLAEIPQENNRKGLVVNARKGVHSLESFIISRYHMYEQVYFHKTTRGFEKLLMHIFKRVRQLLDQGKEVHFINEQIHKVFSGSFKIKDFLFLDDFVIITQLQLWQDNSDRILQTLCNAFVSRQPYKMFKEDNFTPDREF